MLVIFAALFTPGMTANASFSFAFSWEKEFDDGRIFIMTPNPDAFATIATLSEAFGHLPSGMYYNTDPPVNIFYMEPDSHGTAFFDRHETFFSACGNYMAGIGSHIMGPILSFFHKGTLIKNYSWRELTGDQREWSEIAASGDILSAPNSTRTIWHFNGLQRPDSNYLAITMLNRQTFTFDMTTGELVNAYSQAPITVLINGEPFLFYRIQPFMFQGRVYVCVWESIFETIGIGQLQTRDPFGYMYHRQNTFLTIPSLPYYDVLINEQPVEGIWRRNFGVPMVPLRKVAETFGAEVTWDADTHTVIITDTHAPLTILMNGKQVSPFRPFLYQGQVYVDVRDEIFSEQGILHRSDLIRGVFFQRLARDGVELLMSSFYERFYLNGNPIESLTPVRSSPRRFPLCEIMQIFGAEVDWDAETNTLTITDTYTPTPVEPEPPQNATLDPNTTHITPPGVTIVAGWY